MKKIISISLVCLLMAGLFSACGKSLEADRDTVYVQKKGTVIGAAIADFDKDYYDQEELKAFAEEKVEAYQKEHGKDSVKIDEFSVEEKVAKLYMKYASCEDYQAFNEVTLFSGTIPQALAAGYDFNTGFTEIKDGKSAGTVDNKTIVDTDYKVVILSEKVDVKVVAYGADREIALHLIEFRRHERRRVGRVVSLAEYEETVVCLDELRRVQTDGESALHCHALRVDHAGGGAVVGPVHSVADRNVDLASVEGDLVGVRADGYALVDLERERVEACEIAVVHRDEHLALMGDHAVGRTTRHRALGQLYLLDRLAGGAIDHLNRIRYGRADIYLRAVGHAALRGVAEAALVGRDEDILHGRRAVVVDDAQSAFDAVVVVALIEDVCSVALDRGEGVVVDGTRRCYLPGFVVSNNGIFLHVVITYCQLHGTTSIQFLIILFGNKVPVHLHNPVTPFQPDF